MALLRAVVAVLLLGGGCEPALDPSFPATTTPAVHAVLVAGSPTAAVIVTEWAPGGGGARGISGADVRLTRETGESLRLAATAAGAGCHRPAPLFPGGPPATPLAAGCYRAAVPGGLPAGSRWSLRVTFPDGTVATGSVVIPHPPRLLAPAAGLRVPALDHGVAMPGLGAASSLYFGSLPVGWSADSSIGSMHVGWEVLAAHGPGPAALACSLELLPATGGELRPVASGRLYVSGLACGSPPPSPAAAPWDSIRVRLVVSVFDSAYARYQREVAQQRDQAPAIRASFATAGLSGAAGVFAGAASTDATFLLVASDSLPDQSTP